MNSLGFGKKKIFLRIIAFIVIGSFLCSDLAWAGAAFHREETLSPPSRFVKFLKATDIDPFLFHCRLTAIKEAVEGTAVKFKHTVGEFNKQFKPAGLEILSPELKSCEYNDKSVRYLELKLVSESFVRKILFFNPEFLKDDKFRYNIGIKTADDTSSANEIPAGVWITGKPETNTDKGGDKTGDKYIYDPVMKESIVALLRKEYGFIGKKDSEFRNLYNEVSGIFKDVLKAAVDTLKSAGEAKRAEGLMDAEFYLADTSTPNAFAVIYFNFVALNLGLLKALQNEGLLSKHVIAFILAHEVTHLIQYREDVDAGKVFKIGEISSFSEFIRKKFHEHQKTYAREYDADTRCVQLVSYAGYDLAEITVFFEMLEKKKELADMLILMLSDHPPLAERISDLQKIREASNWIEVNREGSFSKEAISEIPKVQEERSAYRQLQDKLADINNFEELNAAIENAKSFDELEFLISWQLTKLLAKESYKLIDECAGVLVSPEYEKALDGIMIGVSGQLKKEPMCAVYNKKLWMSRAMLITSFPIAFEGVDILMTAPDRREIAKYFLFSFLASGNFPSLFSELNMGIVLGNENYTGDEVKFDDTGVFETSDVIKQIIKTRDTCRLLAVKRAEALAEKDSDFVKIATIEAQETAGIDANREKRIIERTEKITENKDLKELLALFKELLPFYGWKHDIVNPFSDLMKYYHLLQEQDYKVFNICFGKIIEKITGFCEEKSLEELLGILDLLIYKERQIIKKGGQKLPGKAEEKKPQGLYDTARNNLTGMVVKKAGLKKDDRRAILEFFLKDRYLYDLEVVGDFVCEELFLNLDAEEKIIESLKSSHELRKSVYERFISIIGDKNDARGKIYLEKMSERGIENIINVFQIKVKEIYQIYQKMREYSEGKGVKEKLNLLCRYLIRAIDAIKKDEDFRPLEEGIFSKELWTVISGITDQEDIEFIRQEAGKVLSESGINCNMQVLDITILKLIFFFNAGGILDAASFRKIALEIIDKVSMENLEIFALFLNSDYMHAKQNKRGIPYVFSVNRVPEEMIYRGMPKTPDGPLVSSTFYQAQTWSEYIFYCNLLIYLKKTGQEDRLSKLKNVDSDMELYKMFMGETILGNPESEKEEKEKEEVKPSGNTGKGTKNIEKGNEFLEAFRLKMSKMFEKVITRFIFSIPKYLDRRDLLDAGESETALFEYIFKSKDSFGELLKEIKAYIPKSVYRNYMILYLLVKYIETKEPRLSAKRGVDISDIKNIIRRRQKKGLDNSQLFSIIEEIIPLLLYDARIDVINQGSLLYLGLRRTGEKSHGFGQKDLSLIVVEYKWLVEKIYYEVIELFHYWESRKIPALAIKVINIAKKYMDMWYFYMQYGRLKKWYQDLKEGKLSNIEEYKKEVAGFQSVFIEDSNKHRVLYDTNKPDTESLNRVVHDVYEKRTSEKGYDSKKIVRFIRTMFVVYNFILGTVKKSKIIIFFSVTHYLFSKLNSMLLKRIAGAFKKPLEAYLFYRKYKRLKKWYLALKKRGANGIEYYNNAVFRFIKARKNFRGTVDIDYTNMQLENFFRETLFKKLYEDKFLMYVIRRIILCYNRIFHNGEKIDVFYFNFHGKQTQIDTGIAELSGVRIEEKIKDRYMKFEGKKGYIEKMFPRKSPQRDKYIEMLAECELSGNNNINKEQLLVKLNSIIDLFANSYFTNKYGLECLEIEKDISAGKYDLDKKGMDADKHYEAVKQNVELACKYFKPGYTRDDILLTVLEKARTYDEYLLIKEKLYQYKGAIIKEEDAAKAVYYEDKLEIVLQSAWAKDKKDFLLWVLGIKKKPLFLREWEVWFGVNFDRVKSAFSGRGKGEFGKVGESLRREFVRQMFIGKGGILENKEVFNKFMDEMFNFIAPKQGDISRKKLRKILKAIINVSDDKRRLEIVQALSVNMAGVFEKREKIGEAEIIARFFESLGLIGVKMAQILAHAMDIPLSHELREALGNLSSRADPLSKMVVFETIQNLCTGGFAENFEYIGDCIGSASIKIVYRAKRKGTDKERIIKIKRPKVKQKLEEDLEFLRNVLDELKKEKIGIPEGLGDRVSAAIAKDTDFEGEYRITEEFARQQIEEINKRNKYRLSDGTGVELAIARIYKDSIINDAIMETDIAEGISLDRAEELIKQGIIRDRKELVEVKRIIFDFLMEQIFRYGFYNADPHGGNFIISRENGKITITLIDCGSAERVEKTRENFMRLLESVIWLSINPEGKIPEEYLYTSVFFKKTDYLRSILPDEDIIEIIFNKMGELRPELSPKKYLAKLRKIFISRMTLREKISYIKKTIKKFKLSAENRSPSNLKGNIEILSSV